MSNYDITDKNKETAGVTVADSLTTTKLSKKGVGIIISFVIGLIAVVVGVFILNRTFIDQGTIRRYKAFNVEDTDYDVLFFGTSHIYCSIYPMQLWNDYGITSYDMSSPSSPFAVSFCNLRESIKLHKPKIAVLEVYATGMLGDTPDAAKAHRYLDSRPLSIQKYKDAKEIFPEDSDAVKELIFPLSIYHKRWNELTASMVKFGFGADNEVKDHEITKGAEIQKKIYKPVNNTRVRKGDYDKKYLTDDNAAYIEKFVSLCRDNHIIPIVISMPFDASAENQKWLNAYIKVADEAGAQTINLFDENLIDLDTDCLDNNHLNASGARKITDFIGQYLVKNCGLEDKRKDPEYSSWNDDYDRYREYLDKMIKDMSDYKPVLMLLNNENFRAELTTTPEHDIENADVVEQKLIAQLGDNITLSTAPDIRTDDDKEADIKLDIYDVVTGEKIATKYFKTDSVDTLVKKES